MAKILGTTPASLIGMDSFSFVFPEDLPAAQHLFFLKKSGSSAPFTFRLRRADGRSVWTDVQGTPMQNAAGRFIGVVGTFSAASGHRMQPPNS
jgi:PAS domain S-box-containing protein